MMGIEPVSAITKKPDVDGQGSKKRKDAGSIRSEQSEVKKRKKKGKSEVIARVNKWFPIKERPEPP